MKAVLLIILAVALSAPDGFAQQKPSGGVPAVYDMTSVDSTLFSREFFAGLKARTLGQADAAFNHFSRCTELDPRSDAAWYELAVLHYRKGERDLALKMINRAVAINDEQPWYLGFKADLLQQDKQHEAIVATFDRLIELQPENWDHYFNKANALVALSRADEAVKVYNRIEAATGYSAEIAVARQRAYVIGGATGEAMEEIDRLIEKYPKEARYYILRGEACAAAGKSRKAIKAWHQALKLDPESGYARLALADHYRTKGKYADSFDQLKAAFATPGLSVDTKIRILLNNYMKKNAPSEKWALAEELAGILMETAPRDARAYAVAGDIFLRQDRQEQAREAYREAVRYEKNILLLWEQLLRLEIAQENYTSIASISEEALRYFPEQAEFYLFNGVANVQLGKYTQAVASLNKGLDLAQDTALKLQFYSNLGDAYHAAGDHAASDKAFEAALRLDRSNGLIMNNYAYYLALREQHLEKAARMSRQSIRLDPENVAYQDTYAWVLYKAGRYAEACKWIEKAIDSFPHSPTFLEHYGDILFQLGEKNEAVEMWNKARELGGRSGLLDQKIKEKKLHE